MVQVWRMNKALGLIFRVRVCVLSYIVRLSLTAGVFSANDVLHENTSHSLGGHGGSR